jgi:hypothetical protein
MVFFPLFGQGRQRDVPWRPSGGRALEGFSIGGEAREKSPVTQEELALLDAAEAVEAIGFAGGIVAESGLG